MLETHMSLPSPPENLVLAAGLIDLLRTKGLWLASLRLAYQQCTGGMFSMVFSQRSLQDPEQGVSGCQPPNKVQLQVCKTPFLTSFDERYSQKQFKLL